MVEGTQKVKTDSWVPADVYLRVEALVHKITEALQQRTMTNNMRDGLLLRAAYKKLDAERSLAPSDRTFTATVLSELRVPRRGRGRPHNTNSSTPAYEHHDTKEVQGLLADARVRNAQARFAVLEKDLAEADTTQDEMVAHADMLVQTGQTTREEADAVLRVGIQQQTRMINEMIGLQAIIDANGAVEAQET